MPPPPRANAQFAAGDVDGDGAGGPEPADGAAPRDPAPDLDRRAGAPAPRPAAEEAGHRNSAHAGRSGRRVVASLKAAVVIPPSLPRCRSTHGVRAPCSAALRPPQNRASARFGISRRDRLQAPYLRHPGWR